LVVIATLVGSVAIACEERRNVMLALDDQKARLWN
jgi:hypothetical protein